MNQRFSYQRGFSLLEMMITLGIASFVMISIFYVVTHQQKQFYFWGEALSAQEHLATGLALVRGGMMGAGEAGCLAVPGIVDQRLDQTLDLKILHGYGVYGFSGDEHGWDPALPHWLVGKVALGSDVVVVEKGSYARENVLVAMTDGFDPVRVQGKNFSVGEVLLISDCVQADLFVVSHIETSSDGQVLYHEASHNRSSALSRPYPKDAQVMRWEAQAYYLAQSSHDPNGLGLFLKNAVGNTAAVELVSQIRAFKIIYALTSVQFLSADLVRQWDTVVGVLVSLQTQAGSGQTQAILYHAG